MYFLLSSATASAADIFLVKTFLTLVRHSASNFMFSILKLDSILLTFLSIVILVSISFSFYCSKLFNIKKRPPYPTGYGSPNSSLMIKIFIFSSKCHQIVTKQFYFFKESPKIQHSNTFFQHPAPKNSFFIFHRYYIHIARKCQHHLDFFSFIC